MPIINSFLNFTGEYGTVMEITGLFHFLGMLDGCCKALRNGFKASREKTYSDPLLVELHGCQIQNVTNLVIQRAAL